MRKFTAREINEVAEVFKETLKACTSSKKTGGWFEFDYDNWVPTTKATVSGQEVDLATLPVGTALANRVSTYFKEELEGWGGYTRKDPDGEKLAEEIAMRETDGDFTEFIYNPLSPGSPDASATFEDEEELRKAIVEDGFIDFGSHQFVVNQGHIPENAVIVVNGTGIYGFFDPCFAVDSLKDYVIRPKAVPGEFAQYGLPIRLDLYLSPFKPF